MRRLVSLCALSLLAAAPLTAQTAQCVTTLATPIGAVSSTVPCTITLSVPLDTVIRTVHDTLRITLPVVHDTLRVSVVRVDTVRVPVVRVDTVYVTRPPVVTPPTDTAKPPVIVPPVVVPPSGGFATPNVLNASFESGWDGFTDWTGANTPKGVTRSNSLAADGSYSILRSWTPNPSGDGGAQFLSKLPPSDHVWVRFSFKLTAPITTVMKFARFYDPNFNTNLGGFFLGAGNNILTFGTDQENAAITTSIGLTQAQVIDGKWHSLEIDYWRNGDPSGYPTAAFYFDGAPVSASGRTQYQCPGAGTCSKMAWSGNRLIVGERRSTIQVGYMEWLATLNAGNTTSGQVNIDRVAISTKGRIGP